MNLYHHYSFAGSDTSPPCIPPNQGWSHGHYFAAESAAMRYKCIAYHGGKPNFEFYEADGLFWFVWRVGRGGPTPRGFEKKGFRITAFAGQRPTRRRGADMDAAETAVAAECAAQAQQNCHRAWDCAVGPEFCAPAHHSHCVVCSPNRSEYISNCLGQGVYDLAHNLTYTEEILAGVIEMATRPYNKFPDIQRILSEAREFAATAAALSQRKTVAVFGHWHRVYVYWHLALEFDKMRDGQLSKLNQHLRAELYGYASYTRELAEHVARGNPEGFPAPENLLLSDLGVATEGLNTLGEHIWLLSDMVANKTTVRPPPA